MAPRALLCTESIDDEFANPLGSLVTSVAAQEVFDIAVNQVTHIGYARFLNAVAAKADPSGLYHPAMALGQGAIRRVEGPSVRRYLVLQGEAPTPATCVSWFDALRYCNWLHHGRPDAPQGPATTEDGAYKLRGGDEAGPRLDDAKFFLPSESEWYKAAYYADGPDGNGIYRHFAPNETHRPMITTPQPDKISPWGMAEFADRVWEWTESPVGELHRALRSGAWFLGNNKQSAGHFYSNPQIRYPSIGFRVARAGPGTNQP